MNTIIKPMLASDYHEESVRFPILVQPKIDGVRGSNLSGSLTGRSLKQHANRFVTNFFSDELFLGLDGELAFGKQTDSALCRNTTSVLNTIEGTPHVVWNVFDYICPESIELPYVDRYEMLKKRLDAIGNACYPNTDIKTLAIVPSFIAENLEQLLEYDTRFLDEGYEGTILRDPNGKYKQGRSTIREGGLLRIKRFVEQEAIVLSIVEGNKNTNPSKTNELGLSERSAHKENLIPNGQVGTLVCQVIATGQIINVAPGKMTEAEAIYYFMNQSEIIGKVIKFKSFNKGVKDKPRFATFQSFRALSDLDPKLTGKIFTV